MLRTYPVIPIIGDGKYPYQPVHVRDMARLCIESGLDDHGEGSYEWDAVSPDAMSFIELLKEIRNILGIQPIFITGVPKEIVWQCTWPMNWYQNDIFVDRNEMDLLIYGSAGSD